MKTVKLYEIDSYLKECECVVQAVTDYNEKPALVLQETIFYPLGGGQLPDTGTLDGVRVIDVVEEDGVIYHILEKAHSFASGRKVLAQIDWDRRFDFMQQHTGEHILSGVVENRLGYKNVGFEINEEFMRVDYDGVFSAEQLEELEDEANRLVIDNRSVEVFVPEKDVIEQLEYRSKRKLEGEVRIVDVQGVDVCACCGTHVNSTAQVGIIKIIDDMHHRGGTRLNVLCGERALRDYRVLNNQSRELSAGLSAPSRELTEAFAHQQLLRQEEVRRMVSLEREILNLRLDDLSSTEEWIHFEEYLQGRDLAKLSAILAKEKEIFLLLSGDDESGYSYILTTQTKDAREIAAAMNQSLDGRGGGKPEVVRGGFKATRDEIERWIDENANFFS